MRTEDFRQKRFIHVTDEIFKYKNGQEDNYRMSKKLCPFLYTNYIMKNGQDLLNIQYNTFYTPLYT